MRDWLRKKWAWKGRPLAAPWDILRRLLMWPILTALLNTTWLVILIGWGYYDAQEFLKRNK